VLTVRAFIRMPVRGIRLAKLGPLNMRFFPESIYDTAGLPILERFGTPDTGVKMSGFATGITTKKGSSSMKNSMRFIALALFVLCFTFTAFAQTQTTGSIEGQVTDPDGKVVPNATITVSGTNLISAQTAQSDDQGRFRVLNLPPGRYTVTVAATAGFAETARSDIEVNLSRTSTADVQVRVAGASAEVTITDTSGATVDVNSNTTGTNVSNEQFNNLPTQRTVQSLYTIAPSVARSGLRDASGRDRDPSVGGSSGPENNYILDGVTTTDPAFGGSGANLPFEFVQEVEIKTGAYGAEYGKSTGGIFNVITKSGSNEIHGDVFAYITTKGLVRGTKNFPFTGSAPNGFSEVDAGIDVGGPIAKDKLWFFGAFNPQRRKNSFLTQTFRQDVENEITTPFYSGKLTWGINQGHTFTFSTFGDFTKQKGFLFGGSGFGNDLTAFRGQVETGGHNYTARLNSSFSPNHTGEFAFGLHFQRANTLPESDLGIPLLANSFAVVRNGTRVAPTQTNVIVSAATGFGDFVNGVGGTLERNFIDGPGFGLFSTQERNRWEVQARMQSITGPHTWKYGFEYNKNIYAIDTRSTGPSRTFGGASLATQGFRVTNNFGVCQVQGTNIVCPVSSLTSRIQALISAGVNLGGPTSVSTNAAVISSLNTNPFLIRTSTRVRDFRLITSQGDTYTNVESFYIQDDYKINRNIQLNLGLRWDFQQAYGSGSQTYLKLNNFWHNLQPRAGFIYDFTGVGKGKFFVNFARFLETPIPLDINVRAGSDTTQTDINLNVDRLNAVAGSVAVADFGNLGATSTPIDAGLRPQTVDEYTAGFEYEVVKDLAIGFRGIYRAQGNVIEDGSFDDGNTYFIFNPGRRGSGETTEDSACLGVGGAPSAQCFGHARRYYRALEFSATKRFTNNYQFIASYVFSSLTGNYEGLFRNDNGQSDPNITSLFDLVSLLANGYGRLPNDRPHQFKLDGSHRWPFKLLTGASFRAQSGIPFNALTPHEVYGNNEGFGVQRGTAIVPAVTATAPGFPNTVDSIGSTRTPMTWNLDLNAYYPIQFGENRQLRLQVDWFNVFNNQRAIRLDETFRINSGIPGVANVPANQFPNPFYGAGTIFQFPSSLRLGVKFQF
jgi:outer membrane receptor protein involved in Fe transport